jgi:hypothetical protein
MLKATQSLSAAGASNAQATNSLSNLAPLAPLNLLRAGVPAREVVWFLHLGPAERMASLQTTRGSLLLETVRAAKGSVGLAGLAV